jgi:hypothetical protein
LSEEQHFENPYTRLLLKELLASDPDFDPYDPRYRGRPIICHNSRITGGVFASTARGEAVVVDDTNEDRGFYDQLYERSLDILMQNGRAGLSYEGRVVYAALQATREALRYDLDGVSDLLNDRAAALGIGDTWPDGKKADLSLFLLAGIGVCRHRALALGYLLERFKKDGHIKGTPTVDRNERWMSNQRDGHTWIRYSAPDGRIVIVDPTDNYVATLEGALADRTQNANRWQYARPDDIERIAKKQPDVQAPAPPLPGARSTPRNRQVGPPGL